MAGYRVRRRPPVGEVADIVPTAERHNHGIVERLEQTIGDSSGRPSRPYRFVDTLAAMERRGSITAGMRQAGEDFRDRFAIAQLDPLLGRLPAGVLLQPPAAAWPPPQNAQHRDGRGYRLRPGSDRERTGITRFRDMARSGA